MQDHRYGLYPTNELAGICPAFVLKSHGMTTCAAASIELLWPEVGRLLRSQVENHK